MKAGDWYHNDEGAEVYVRDVKGDSVYLYEFEPGQSSRSIVPKLMEVELFAEELAKMKPGRMPGMEGRGLGWGYVDDDDAILIPRK